MVVESVFQLWLSKTLSFVDEEVIHPSFNVVQSVTSRLETSRYRDFSQFFESIGICLKNLGLEKKSRYRSPKYLVLKKSLLSVSKIFGLKKSLGIGLEKIRSRKKVSVSVSMKFFGLGTQCRLLPHRS